jgi:hypothetical protein
MCETYYTTCAFKVKLQFSNTVILCYVLVVFSKYMSQNFTEFHMLNNQLLE